MASVGDDCYFYYYSSCTKGSTCPFRHCPASLGNEVTCSLWQMGKCFRPNCKFRHMEIQVDRSQIACYWENQAVGCTKPHCVFKHFRPRPYDIVPPVPEADILPVITPPQAKEAKTTTAAAAAGYGRSAVVKKESDGGESLPVTAPLEPTPPGHSSPVVQPVIVNTLEDDSDIDSTGTGAALSPFKSERPLRLSSPVKTTGDLMSSRLGVQRRPVISETEPASSFKAKAKPAAKVSSSGQSSVVRLKSVKKDDDNGIAILSLEEIHRQKALESMKKARAPVAPVSPVSVNENEDMDDEDPAFDCRRVVVDSEEPSSPKPARISIQDRLGGKVRVPVKQRLELTGKKKASPPPELEPSGKEGRFARIGLSVKRHEEKRASLTPKEHTTHTVKKKAFRLLDPEPEPTGQDGRFARITLNMKRDEKKRASLTPKERTTPKMKKKALPLLEPEPSGQDGRFARITLNVKGHEKKRASVTPQERTTTTMKKKALPMSDPEPEPSGQDGRFARITLNVKRDEKKPASLIPKERTTPKMKKKALPLPDSEPEPTGQDGRFARITLSVKRDEKKPASLIPKEEPKPRLLKKRVKDRLDSSAVEKKRRKITLVEENPEKEVKSHGLEVTRRKGALTVNRQSDEEDEADMPALSRQTSRGLTLSLDTIRKRRALKGDVDEDNGAKSKRLPRQSLSLEAVRQRNARQIHRSSDEEEEEEEEDDEEDCVGKGSKSPKVLTLEEIRRRKALKEQQQKPDSGEDSGDERPAAEVLSLTEIRRRRQLKGRQSVVQPVDDIGVFTDRGEKAKAVDVPVLSLEEIRQKKQKKLAESTADEPKSVSARLVGRKEKVTPSKRPRIEQQIYVPPARKQSLKQSVAPAPATKPAMFVLKASVCEDAPSIKRRLAVKTEPAPAQPSQAKENKESASVSVKTFSEIMAEKRRKRQQEKEQQNKGHGQEENTEEKPARKTFRIQPVSFTADSTDQQKLKPESSGFSRVISSSDVSKSLPSSTNKSQGVARPSAQSRLGVKTEPAPTVSEPAPVKTWTSQQGRAEISALKSGSLPTQRSAEKSPGVPAKPQGVSVKKVESGVERTGVADSAKQTSVTPSIFTSQASAAEKVAESRPSLQSKSVSAAKSVPVAESSVPASQTGVSERSPSLQLKSPTSVNVKGSVQPSPSVTPVATKPTQKSSQVLTPSPGAASSAGQLSGAGQSQSAEKRRLSSQLSLSRHLSDSQDELLLANVDEVSLDDGEQIDDLLMDIDSLLD